MSSATSLRAFIDERLSAAAEEIFRLFERTVVQYEEEIHRQRTLLDSVCAPQTLYPLLEFPQQHVCKEEEEEVFMEQRSASVSPEDAWPSGIQDDQRCHATLAVKQEADVFGLTVPNDEGDQSAGDEPGDLRRAGDEESEDNSSVQSAELPEPPADHVFFCEPSESQDQCRISLRSGKAKTNQQANEQTRPAACTSPNQPPAGLASLKCETCEKGFKFRSKLIRHMRTHTGERPFSCNVCGKSFNQMSVLKVHRRIHTGEKPYRCQVCGKKFSDTSTMRRHMRTHTGEKPFSCFVCGKRFCEMRALKNHERVHTGDRPYACDTCGKTYRYCGDLTVHMKTHKDPVSV